MGPSTTETLVKAPSGWPLDLREVWAYRELLYFLSWRDIKVRYKQTLIGAAWAILQPFLTMVVFTVIFGNLLGVPSGGIPYPVFTYSALVPWTFFSTAITRSSNSLVYDASLISRVYFPRLIVPLAATLAPAVDFAFAFLILIGMMFFYGIVPTAAVVSLPAFALLALVTAFGVGLWLSALNVRYRDIGYATPFLLQFWLFITPVAYPSSVIPETWRALYGLNPMAGVVEGFRWALLGGEVPVDVLPASMIGAAALLVTGLVYFGRMEAHFADVV
jgi:lipopolysaccharide transport system permease protein